MVRFWYGSDRGQAAKTENGTLHAFKRKIKKRYGSVLNQSGSIQKNRSTHGRTPYFLIVLVTIQMKLLIVVLF